MSDIAVLAHLAPVLGTATRACHLLAAQAAGLAGAAGDAPADQEGR